MLLGQVKKWMLAAHGLGHYCSMPESSHSVAHTLEAANSKKLDSLCLLDVPIYFLVAKLH